MLLQVTLRIFLLAFVVINVQSARFQPKFCAECEEEVWEEVPCDALYPSSTTTTSTTYIPPTGSTTTPFPSSTTTSTTTTKAPIVSTTKAPTTTSTYSPPSSSADYSIASTISPPIYATIQNSSEHPIESSDGYKKCYCECKSGCREFCRKVVLYPDARKQILQLSKTTELLDNGHVEVKHLHERNFVTSPPSPLYYNNKDIESNPYNQQKQQQQYQQPQQEKLSQLVYVQSTPSPVFRPRGNSPYPYDGNSHGFALEEFSKVLSTGQEYSNIIPGISHLNYPLPNLQSYDSPVHISQPVSTSSANSAVNSGASASAIAIAPKPLNNEQQYASNAIPGSSQTYETIRNKVKPSLAYLFSHGYTPQYPPKSVDVKTASCSGGNAAAIAISPNNYKTSHSSNPGLGYKGSILTRSPYAVRYTDTSMALNSLQNLEPTIENYMREFVQLPAPKTQRYGYPL